MLTKLNKKHGNVEKKVIKNVRVNYKRSWELSTVWYEKKPVMICQSAGRWRNDHIKKIITNKQLYDRLLVYAQQLIYETAWHLIKEN